SHVNTSNIKPEVVMGKQILLGYDTQGPPAFYMIPNKQMSSNEMRLAQFSVFMLERCIDLMPPGIETLNFLISFLSSSSQPSLMSTRSVLSTLQTHCPERLGHATLTNPPLILNILIKFALAFANPITHAKCKFDSISLLKEDVFKPEGLMKGLGWGGNLDFEFQHKKYWPELLRIAEERQKSWRERWRELGGGIGVREQVYKRPTVVGRTPSDSKFISSALGSKLHYCAISVTVDCGDDDSWDHKSPWVIIGSAEHCSGDESGGGGN
ncbi:CRAL/TRIO domain-containing protein, partial [Macrolepiota fuliginosa MF-IS2]